MCLSFVGAKDLHCTCLAKHCKSTKNIGTLYSLKPQPQKYITSAITQVDPPKNCFFSRTRDKLFIKGFVLMK